MEEAALSIPKGINAKLRNKKGRKSPDFPEAYLFKTSLIHFKDEEIQAYFFKGICIVCKHRQERRVKQANSSPASCMTQSTLQMLFSSVCAKGILVMELFLHVLKNVNVEVTLKVKGPRIVQVTYFWCVQPWLCDERWLKVPGESWCFSGKKNRHMLTVFDSHLD